METTVTTPMPKYRSFKEVWALKIAAVERIAPLPFTKPTCRGSFVLGSACGHCERCTWETEHGPKPGGRIVPADEGYAPFEVSAGYMEKHQPVAGGYFVQYADGYKSFSPAEAFEGGYTRIA